MNKLQPAHNSVGVIARLETYPKVHKVNHQNKNKRQHKIFHLDSKRIKIYKRNKFQSKNKI